MNKRIKKKKLIQSHFSKSVRSNYLINCFFNFSDCQALCGNYHIHTPWRFYLKQKNFKKSHTFLWNYKNKGEY